MRIVRVFYHPDQTIEVFTCSPKKTLDEAAKIAGRDHLPYDDMDVDDLPKGKGISAKLRGEKGKGVWVDNTIETRREAYNDLVAKLDSELDSSNPDPIKAMKLQRDIERIKKEKWQSRKKIP